MIQHLWSLLLILILILVFHFQVVTSVLVSIALCIIIYRVTLDEIRKFIFAAFEKKMLGNTFLVLCLKELIAHTGVLLLLPDAMAKLPLPTYLIFGLLFFTATVISGSTGAIAMGTPLAFAAIPGGAPLMAYLMCMAHAPARSHLPCMSGGGSRLFSCDVRRYCKENTACFYCLLRINDAIL